MTAESFSAVDPAIPPLSPPENEQVPSGSPDGPPVAKPPADSYEDAWRQFQERFDAVLAEQEARYRGLLELARALPDAADREVARARAEGDRRIAEERARRRAMLASVGESCETIRQRISLLSAALEAAAERVDALTSFIAAVAEAAAEDSSGAGEEQPARPEAAAIAQLDAQAVVDPPSGNDIDPWAVVDAARRLFQVHRSGSRADRSRDR